MLESNWREREDTIKWLERGEDIGEKNPFWQSSEFKASFEELAAKMAIPVPYERALADYHSLCNAKHAHPFLIRNVGVVNSGTNFTLFYGATAGQQQRVFVAQHGPMVLRTLMWGVLGFMETNSDCIADLSLFDAELSDSFLLAKLFGDNARAEFADDETVDKSPIS